MAGGSLPEFYHKIKTLLSEASLEAPSNNSYVDLAVLTNLSDLPDLARQETFRDNPLKEVFAIILPHIALGDLDKVEISVNEICKNFLLTVDEANQEMLTPAYTRLWQLLFRRCLMRDFPYPELFWDYLVRCLQATGLNLLDRDLSASARLVLESLAVMGREAAQKGLPTAGTQSALRMLENRARIRGYENLAASAHNFRFNLETY